MKSNVDDLMPGRRPLLRTALVLLPLQITTRAGEAALPLLLAAWFGRSVTTDLFYATWAIFTFFGSCLFSAFHDSALIPILAEVKHSDRNKLPNVLGSLAGLTLLVGGTLATVLGAAVALWYKCTVESHQAQIVFGMAPLFSVYLVSLSIKTLLVCVFHSENKFFVAPFASFASIVSSLLVIYFGREWMGIVSVPGGMLAGELAAIVFLGGFANTHLGIRFQLNLSRPEPVRRFASLMASEVGGSVVTRVNPVVDQMMAVLAGVAGGGTLLRYTSDVSSVPTSLLQSALLPVLLTHLSEDFVKGHQTNVRATTQRALWTTSLLLTIVAFALFLVRRPLLRLAFLHGEMDVDGVEVMAQILPYHLIGLPAFGALLILSRAHVAMQNSRIMFPLGILNAGLNVLFNLILVRKLGLSGIALSTSLVQIAIAIVFWILFQNRSKTYVVA